MSNETTKEKKTRTTRNPESIEKGALALPLADRVALVKTLNAANQKEVEKLQADAATASGLLKG